jgi:UDP-sugar transporter A1/2/3
MRRQNRKLTNYQILITALFSVVLLRRHLGPKRWFALIILTLGVSVVSLPQGSSSSSPSYIPLRHMTDHFFPRSLHELGHVPSDGGSGKLAKRSATYQGIDNDLPPLDPLMNYSVGLTSVLVAATVSGLTGVYFEKLLKESPTQASVWIRNVQLSFYSIFAAGLGGVIWQDGEGISEHGFFEGYNWVVWTAVFLQAAGGILASVVIRDADNIVKNFATSISIVISFLISVLVFHFEVSLTVSSLSWNGGAIVGTDIRYSSLSALPLFSSLPGYTMPRTASFVALRQSRSTPLRRRPSNPTRRLATWQQTG